MKYDKVEYQVVRDAMESRCTRMAAEPYTGCPMCERAFLKFQESLSDYKEKRVPLDPGPIAGLKEIKKLRTRRYGWKDT